MPRLAVRITNAPDILIERLRGCMCHCFSSWIGTQQSWGYHIHPLISALGAENYGHKQFEGVAIPELGFRRCVMGLKVFQYLFVSFSAFQ